MARVKFQLYMQEDTGAWIEGMCKVFGWSATEVVDRLLRYYLRTRSFVEDYEEIVFDNGDAAYLVTNEYGEEALITSPDPLIIAIKEGLVPQTGFGEVEPFGS
jgi:hypothetical protein